MLVVERTDNAFVLRFPLDTDLQSLQKVIDYLKIKEIVKNSAGTEEEANSLADESKKDWWQRNKERFINRINAGA